MKHLLLFTLLLGVVGCNDEVDATLSLDVPFSLYGYLDPTADQQAIRVVPIADLIDSDSDVIDAAVTSTDLESGEMIAWRDSLISFPDGSRGHVFVADFTPRPGTTIEIEAKRSDGVASTVKVTIPPIVQPAVGSQTFVEGGIGYPLRIEGAPRVLQGEFRIVVGGYPGDDPGVTRRLTIPFRTRPTESEPGVWSVTVPFVDATRRYLESLGVLDAGLGLVALEYSFFVTESAWAPPSMDLDALAEPGTFSNVDAGLGFVGAGYLTSVRWMAGLDAAAAAGFDIGDDPATALVINEIVVGDNGWIEFYNPTLSAISLRGYSLTNSPSTPRLQPIISLSVPPRDFASVDLTFPVNDRSGALEVGVYNRTGDLALHVAPLKLYPPEGGPSSLSSYGSYPDGLSTVVRKTVGFEERIYDIFRGPLRPTRNAPNELGLEVAYINEVYTQGSDGWVETVSVMPGLGSLSVFHSGDDDPGAFYVTGSTAQPSGTSMFGVAEEQMPGLILNQTGGTVFALAFYRDPRVVPLLGPGKPPQPINPDLDPTTQLRVVDYREFAGQTPGRSSGYLPDAPGGRWTTDLRPTRGTPNTSARRAQ